MSLSSTLGDPIIEVFSPTEYKAHTQNWFITQDDLGIIYVGNGSGLLSYDAEQWRLFQTDDQGPIHGLAQLNNRHYVGTISDIGYFENTTNGKPKYTSITHKLPKTMQDFSDVNRVFTFKNEVYWTSYQSLMRQNSDGSFTHWKPESNFKLSWISQDQLYISDPPYLKKLVNDSLVRVKGFESLKEPTFSFVIELNKGLLVGTKNQGIYTLINGVAQPWLNKSNPLSQLLIYGAKQVNGLVAVNTIKGGVLFFDKTGNFVYQLDKTKGLATNVVLNMYQDKQLALWLAQDGYITRVQLPFDVSVFSLKKYGLGSINKINFIDNKIYAVGANGIFKQNESGSFEKTDLINSKAYSFFMLNNHAIGLEFSGIYEYNFKQNTKRQLLKSINSPILYQLKNDNNSLLMVASNGVYLLQLDANNQLQPPRLLFSAKNKPTNWAEDEKGHLWWSLSNHEIIKIQPEKHWQVERIPIHLDAKPNFFFADNELLISQPNGLFIFDRQSHKATDQKQWFSNVFGRESQGPDLLIEDSQGAIWLRTNEQQGVFSKPAPNGKRTFQQQPIKSTGLHHLKAISEINNIHWLVFDNGLARVDRSKTSQAVSPSIAISSLSYVNHQTQWITPGIRALIQPQSIDYQPQLLRFHFSLTDYHQPFIPSYRYRINSQQWSHWSEDNFADIAGLWNGDYRFEIQAKDFYDNVITAQPLVINIIPAWYLSYWAFLFYAILVISFIYTISLLITKKHTQKLRQDKMKLENIITERTGELLEKTEKLEAMDEAKSRFFANVSHEFRTPLTLTMGPLEEILRENSLDKNIHSYASTALRNAKRMMALLGQILDVNRLEAGHVDMRVVQYDLADTCRNELKAIAMQAKRMNIQLKVSGLDEPLLIYFDQDQVSKIIMNLLSNALKFTSAGGLIHFSLESLKYKVLLSVTDNGKGMSAQVQSHIFERYYQAKDNQNLLQPGTGIGLSLVKELIELHQGEIKVESTLGKGSCFKVTLLKGKAHFDTNDLLELTSVLKAESASSINELTNNSLEALECYPLENDSSSDSTSQNKTISQQEKNQLKTILVADDNSELRAFIRLRLDQTYHVIEAEDGQQALELTKIHLPDLVISDVMMPNMTGLEFASIMKSDPEISHIPLILLTARSTKRDIVEGLQGGANDYLTKPFDTSELSARILGLLNQQERLRGWIKTNPQAISNLSSSNLASSNLTTSNLSKSNLSSSGQQPDNKKRPFNEVFNDYIHQNISNHKLSVENISEALNMERTTLFRKVKKEFNSTTQQYLLNARLKYAADLLRNKQGTVSEIAYAVGFVNYSYFNRSFSKYYNVTPGLFIKNNEMTQHE